ncbi:conserved fungal protein [Sugiyamaella lignohabitans]|uniref:Conserved fungal protein n=1 Tax=Sugiyamaella lignohabitans TaxID=796027 RepID=A0A161HGB1_9ASCO|nr:uncharacterized protein AWJ20_1290 [Sugiyamaella lignohabitans]ANB13012.1 conserved fungal protein [Sugiyamaella lignohabitans]
MNNNKDIKEATGVSLPAGEADDPKDTSRVSDKSEKKVAFQEPDPNHDSTHPSKKKTPSAAAACSLYSILIKLRTFLRKLSAIAANHMDPTLSTIGYSSLLLSAIVKATPTRSLSSNFRSLYSMISDFRMFLRLWGTLSVAEWTVDTLADPGSDDPLIKFCTYIQAIAGTLYQLLEDLAYLSSKKVISLSAPTEGKIWIVSCYFWALHVQLELIKIFRRKWQGEKNLLTSFIVNLAWLPLTVHWSTESGFLQDHHVGFFGTLASAPRVIPHWIKGFNEY